MQLIVVVANAKTGGNPLLRLQRDISGRYQWLHKSAEPLPRFAHFPYRYCGKFARPMGPKNPRSRLPHCLLGQKFSQREFFVLYGLGN